MKTPLELAQIAFEAAKNSVPFERSIRTTIGENHHYPITTARSSFIHSYLARFFVEKAILVDYNTLLGLSEKDQAVFRKEVRRLALVEFDRIAAEPIEIPEYMVQDAIKLLEKAGYMVLPSGLNSRIKSLSEIQSSWEIGNGDNGFTLSNQDVSEIATVLVELLSNDQIENQIELQRTTMSDQV